MEDTAFAGVYTKTAMLTPSLCVLGAGSPLLTCLFMSTSVCCRMRDCQWNLGIRSWSTVMRIEQLLKKLQSSCCEPDFTQEERAENRGEALKTLITEISAAVMTALSEFIDEIDQNLPITAELVGKFDAHCTRPRPARVVVSTLLHGHSLLQLSKKPRQAGFRLYDDLAKSQQAERKVRAWFSRISQSCHLRAPMIWFLPT